MTGEMIAIAAYVCAGAVTSVIVQDRFLHNVMFLTFLWAGLGQAWNIVGGFVGRTSLGHAAYFAIGAYTSTLLFLHLGLSPWAGLLAGAGLAAAGAALVEGTTARLSGSYYALGTYALAALLFIVARGWRSLTRGTMGLVIPFAPSLETMSFADPRTYTGIALVYCAVVIGVSRALWSSRLGYFLRAIRDDEHGALASGVDTRRQKILAGMLSAALVAAGGTLYSQFLLFVDPETVLGVDVTLRFVLVTILGGVGTLAGPLLGASILVPSERWLVAEFGASLRGAHLLLFGPLLAATVIFMPDGAVSGIRTLVRKWVGRRVTGMAVPGDGTA